MLKKAFSFNDLSIHNNNNNNDPIDDFLLADLNIKKFQPSFNLNNLFIKSFQTFAFFSIILYQIWPKYFFNAFIGIDM